MMKTTTCIGIRHHIIHFEEWPLDCLVRYIEKKQRLLLTTMAPKIMADIRSLNLNNINRPGSLHELDDLFTSCVNRLVIQITRQDKKFLPYLNQLIVATERKLPLNINLFSVVYDCMDFIRQDHSTQNKIFVLMNATIKDSKAYPQKVICPQLFSALRTFENELFHILDLQRQVLIPKVCRMASRF